MEEAAPPKGSFPFEYVRHEVGGARPASISQVRTRGVDVGTGIPNRVDAVYRDFDTELVDVRVAPAAETGTPQRNSQYERKTYARKTGQARILMPVSSDVPGAASTTLEHSAAGAACRRAQRLLSRTRGAGCRRSPRLARRAFGGPPRRLSGQACDQGFLQPPAATPTREIRAAEQPVDCRHGVSGVEVFLVRRPRARGFRSGRRPAARLRLQLEQPATVAVGDSRKAPASPETNTADTSSRPTTRGSWRDRARRGSRAVGPERPEREDAEFTEDDRVVPAPTNAPAPRRDDTTRRLPRDPPARLGRSGT